MHLPEASLTSCHFRIRRGGGRRGRGRRHPRLWPCPGRGPPNAIRPRNAVGSQLGYLDRSRRSCYARLFAAQKGIPRGKRCLGDARAEGSVSGYSGETGLINWIYGQFDGLRCFVNKRAGARGEGSGPRGSWYQGTSRDCTSGSR